MKQYREGPKAKQSFERAMKTLFRTPKTIKLKKRQDKPAAKADEDKG
jgi:hypothetical protein